jgi:adenosylmethionine-8-amino-7-oxononanoate aminotransferase
MQTAPLPLPVVATYGVRIKLEDGRELIDGISSWWTACHGYNHPYLQEKIAQQLQQMPHIMFADLAHQPAYLLAERLSALQSPGLERVFFCDSGSVAVEVAMKMAVQYFHNQGQQSKSKFVSFVNGYHGDTCLAMSLGQSSMHNSFVHFVPKQHVLALPQNESELAIFDQALSKITEQVAALIIEPLVQCAGGMKFHDAKILSGIYSITKKHGLLFIADEIATGFGRTGQMFAYQQAGITPDIICIGKALTGGTMTLAATIATNHVFAQFLSDSPSCAFMHGPTFMANPLACAAANASLDLFEQEPRLEQLRNIEQQLKSELSLLRELAIVKDIRVMGAIGVVELHEVRTIDLQSKFIDEGVFLRPIGNIIYIMPAFTISLAELSFIIAKISKVLRHCF